MVCDFKFFCVITLLTAYSFCGECKFSLLESANNIDLILPLLNNFILGNVVCSMFQSHKSALSKYSTC